MLTKNAVGNLINRYKAVLANCRLLNAFGALALAGTVLTANHANAAYIDTVKAYDPATGNITDLITAYDENGYSITTTAGSIITFTADGTDFYVLKDGAAMTDDDKTNNRVLSGTVPTDTIYIGNNTADGDNGGAIVHREENHIDSMAGFTFFGNVIGGFGGAISNTGDYNYLSITGSTFIANSATAGGAIYTDTDAFITTINSSIFIGNTATHSDHSSWDGKLFNGSGGAIYNGEDGECVIGPVSNSIFIGNSAYNNGGAIFYDITEDYDPLDPPYRPSFEISTTTFIGNTAGGNGGAIYTKRSVIFNANSGEKVEFTDNKAGSDFNAIYVADDNNDDYTDPPTLDFKLAGTGNIYMNDGISGNIAYTVNITGTNSTGALYLNDEMNNAGELNITGATLVLGSYKHSNGEITTGKILGGATINMNEDSTLRGELSNFGSFNNSTTFTKNNDNIFGASDGTLILTNSGVTGMTTGNYSSVLIDLKDKLVDDSSYSGTVILGGVTWENLTSLDDVKEANGFTQDGGMYSFDKVVSAGKHSSDSSCDNLTISGIAQGANETSISDDNLTLTGTMSGVDVAVLDGGTLKVEGGELNIGDERSEKPLLFNGNLTITNDGETNVNAKTTFTGTTTVGDTDSFGSHLNVEASGTTFGKTIISNCEDNILSVNATNTTFGTTDVNGGLLRVLKTGTTFTGTTTINDGKLNVGATGTKFNGETTVSGGELNLYAGATGTTFSTTEVSGGELNVYATGSTFGTTTVSGGELNVYAIGSTFGAITLSGGLIQVSSDSSTKPNSAVFAGLTKGTNAGSLYIENTYSQVTAGIDGGLNHYVGTGGVLNSGAALTAADLTPMTKNMGLTTTAIDGGGFISEGNAVFVHNSGKTLNIDDSKLIVDSGVDSDGYVGSETPSGVYFGANSALIVNTANLGTNAAINGGGATIHIDPSSKLGLLGVKSGEYTILDGFAASSNAGWTKANVYALNALYEIEDVSIADTLATDGAYKVTLTKVSAETAFDSMDKNLASALDSYKGGNAFLDNALATSAVNKPTSEKSIESATKTAVTSGLGSAIGHVGTASVGNIEKRNGSTQAFSENDTRYMLAMSGDGVILPMDKAQEGIGIWFMPMYKHSSADGFESGNYNYGYDTNIYGATLGADYTFASSLRLGLAFNVGTGDSESTGDFDTTKNDFDYFGLTAYGNMHFGKLALSADLGYTASSNDINQDNTFGRLSADADAGLLSFGLKGEYGFDFESFNLTPYAGVRVNYYNIDSFDTKHQGATTISTAESDYTLVEFPVGLTLDTTLQSGGWDITPSLGLGVKFAAGDLDVDQKVRYTGAQSAVLSSEVADAITFQGALGLDMAKDVYSLGLGYTLDLSENVQSHGVRLDLRYEF